MEPETAEDDDDLTSSEIDIRVVYSGTRGLDHTEKAVEPKYTDNMIDVEVGQPASDKIRDEFGRDTNLRDFSERSIWPSE